jgi:hypothetical protein
VTEEVRRAALAYLGRGADPRFSQHYVVTNAHQQTGCSETEVWEALWELVVEGLLYLDSAGQQSGTDNWRWRLSTVGRHVVKDGTWEPRDREGYPTGRQVDQDTAHVPLTIAPVYLRKMHLLSAHFAGMPAGAST